MQLEEYMKTLGYRDFEIDTFLKRYPYHKMKKSSILDNMKRVCTYFTSCDYTEEEVVKMAKKFPSLYNYGKENLEQKRKDMMELGYQEEEITEMTKVFPALYSYGKSNMVGKIEDLMDLGYTREEVLQMTKTLPTLYGYHIDNIRSKINYLREIGLSMVPLRNTKDLVQSIDVTYARYEFLKARGSRVTEEHYKILFCSNKTFEKQYGVSKEQLLEKYPYQREDEKQK